MPDVGPRSARLPIHVALAALLGASGLLPLCGWLALAGRPPPASLWLPSALLILSAAVLLFRPTRATLLALLVAASVSVAVAAVELPWMQRRHASATAFLRSATTELDPETAELLRKV